VVLLSPTLYPSKGIRPTQPGFSRDPGPDQHAMFVHVPAEMVQGNEQTLGIRRQRVQNWGGCDVYMATAEDGLRHLCRASFRGQARWGLHGGASRGGGPRRRPHALRRT